MEQSIADHSRLLRRVYGSYADRYASLKKMKTVKEIWTNEKLRCGGFYELAIEVSENNKPRGWIEEILKSIFELEYIEGPFDNELNKADFFLDMENGYGVNLGYLKIDDNRIPFKTVFISEEGKNESNWVDMCFYTAMYEHVLGNEYQTWATNGNWHKGFDEMLIKVLNHLNSKQKIRLGVLGFEVSGMYYLQTLKEKELTENDISHTKFFVNKGEELNGKNWELVHELE